MSECAAEWPSSKHNHECVFCKRAIKDGTGHYWWHFVCKISAQANEIEALKRERSGDNCEGKS